MVTVPLVMEYEDVLLRPSMVRVTPAAVHDVKDDMVLEAAVNGQCQAIVTRNIRDFSAASEFGIAILNPQTFLRTLSSRLPESLHKNAKIFAVPSWLKPVGTGHTRLPGATRCPSQPGCL